MSSDEEDIEDVSSELLEEEYKNEPKKPKKAAVKKAKAKPKSEDGSGAKNVTGAVDAEDDEAPAKKAKVGVFCSLEI